MEYYKANKDTAVIRSEDAAYMLSFAIMMLHTSLHNPSVRSRITKKQWVSMNRGGCGLSHGESPCLCGCGTYTVPEHTYSVEYARREGVVLEGVFCSLVTM